MEIYPPLQTSSGKISERKFRLLRVRHKCGCLHREMLRISRSGKKSLPSSEHRQNFILGFFVTTISKISISKFLSRFKPKAISYSYRKKVALSFHSLVASGRSRGRQASRRGPACRSQNRNQASNAEAGRRGAGFLSGVSSISQQVPSKYDAHTSAS